MTRTLPIARFPVATACVAVAAFLSWSAPPAGAEEFEVEVVSGSTVSRVSVDAGGIRREVVTHADPYPPPPEPEVEELADPPDPVIIVVKPDPPRDYDRGIVVHSNSGRPTHSHPGHGPRPGHRPKAGQAIFPSPGSSVRGGGMVGGVRH